jgi:predicted Rdx family selenoprotein
VQLEVGSSGEFTVWVDGVKVAEKLHGVFPPPAEIVAAVRRQLNQ